MTSTQPATNNDSRNTLIRAIVQHEWNQFQNTNNEGGRAACQGNWPTFNQMRSSQFLTWPLPLLESYLNDLDKADQTGRNLITEKYGRMMASTAPADYRANIEPYIPTLSEERIALQERIIAQQVTWAADFRHHWPKLGRAMRVLTTAEDSDAATSFETYLRGELGTYSAHTLALYGQWIEELAAQHRNLTEETIDNTVRLGGFDNLAEAEAAQ